MSRDTVSWTVDLIIHATFIALFIVFGLGLVADYSIYTFRAVRKFWDQGKR